MPRYEFFCHNCKKLFSKILSLADYEDGDVLCPQCGSNEVEQCRSAQIDGTLFAHDVVIDRGEIRKRKKKPS